jgi:hypothetical protein
MRNGFLTGIAASTFVAQVALSASLAWLTCRHLGVNYAGWLGKSLLLPIVVTAAGFGLRLAFPPESAGNIAILAAAYLGILWVAAWLAGVDREMIEREWRLVRGMLSGAG